MQCVEVVLMVVLMNVVCCFSMALWLRDVWRRSKTKIGEGLNPFMHPYAFSRRACMFHTDLVISHSNLLPSSVMVRHGFYGRMTCVPLKAVSGSNNCISSVLAIFPLSHPPSLLPTIHLGEDIAPFFFQRERQV